MRKKNTDLFPQIEQYINDYREGKDMSPSVREIADALGVSHPTVTRYLAYMKEHNMLEYGGIRNITTQKRKLTNESTIQVPRVGKIACGLPKEALEDIKEYVLLPISLFGRGNFFILEADGASMIGAGIEDGDLVLIRQQDTAQPGQIVVALVDQELATLKRFRPDEQNHRVLLVPENDAFEVQVIDLNEHTFSIQGVAVKVIKDVEHSQI